MLPGAGGGVRDTGKRKSVSKGDSFGLRRLKSSGNDGENGCSAV